VIVNPLEVALAAAIQDSEWRPVPLGALGFAVAADRRLGDGYTARVTGNTRTWWWDAWHDGTQIGPKTRTVADARTGMRAAMRRIAEHRGIEQGVSA
jgi:hypothetical protein